MPPVATKRVVRKPCITNVNQDLPVWVADNLY